MTDFNFAAFYAALDAIRLSRAMSTAQMLNAAGVTWQDGDTAVYAVNRRKLANWAGLDLSQYDREVHRYDQ
jgi:hypothetical protein